MEPIANCPLRCGVCGHDQFIRQENDSDDVMAAALLGIILVDVSGTCLVCGQCGYVSLVPPELMLNALGSAR